MRIIKNHKERLRFIFKAQHKGFDNYQIANALGISRRSLQYDIKHLKKIIAPWERIIWGYYKLMIDEENLKAEIEIKDRHLKSRFRNEADLLPDKKIKEVIARLKMKPRLPDLTYYQFRYMFVTNKEII